MFGSLGAECPLGPGLMVLHIGAIKRSLLNVKVDDKFKIVHLFKFVGGGSNHLSITIPHVWLHG